MTIAFDFTVTTDRMEAFRSISGDDNPIHFDTSFARDRGFDGPIVYGGLLIAEVSRLLGTALPGHGCVWQSLTMKFRRPLLVGEHARLEAEVKHETPPLGIRLIRLTISAGGRRIAEGEAMTLLPGPRSAREAAE
ncbi:3-hydroxybutyryl-CoA dehydratase [[Luteovulum] sphaeroides subsp. megalophilum]|uniref:MaoC/PaaZ C-terminal domain-containing protein n=1 Tax=Cereibacter sphaeroides TaxID=1063 RepID=UPI000B6A87B9|nr:MaoC/PaaZ C-terminal domain-containing protein [Cereibacter sphaeroides]SNT31984.1 3-hydroxybutyryl-CoA dehydratase [[Luteovulum] sphaeroides subsp. megalophilum]